MFQNSLKIAWRNLLKDRQFSFLNLLGLSTGLACVLLIWFWVADERSIDKFNANDSRLYEVLKKGTDGTGAVRVGKNTQGMLAESMAAGLPEVEYAVAVKKDNNASVLSFGDKHFKVTHRFAGKNFFRVFSYPLIDGKSANVEGVRNVFISDKLAMKIFNSTAITGKTINWDYKGETDFSGVYSIAGVYTSPPANASDQFDLLLPFDLYAEKNAGGRGDVTFWGSNMAATYIVLKKGTDISAFDKKIVDFSIDKVKSLYPANKEMLQYEGKLFTRKYSDAYLHNNFVDGKLSGGRIEYVKLFSVVAIFILLIACINFMNLSTAKASGRFKEIGIRKVVGASRRSLVLQYFTESLLMAFASLLVALLMVQLLFPAFRAITGKNIQLPFTAGLFASIAGIAIVTGIVAGSYPALYLSTFKPVLILKGKTSTGPGASFVRKALVVFQFAVSVILIASVLVVYQQMKLIQTTSLGYNKDNIVQFANDGNLLSHQAAFLTSARKLPGVLHASGMGGNLLGQAGHSGGGISWPGKDPNLHIEYYGNAAGYDFFETMNLQVVEGRTFSPAFNDSTSVIFNQSAIAAMGIKQPIGMTVDLWGQKKQIIGVVKDYHFESMYKKIGPSFIEFSNNNPNTIVKIQAGKEQKVIAGLSKLFATYNYGLEFNYTFMDEDYQALYASEQRVASLSAYFAGIAILISCLGLFGLAAFTAQKRQKEIGIRKVIGASVANITTMLSGEFLQLVVLAHLIALPLAWWALSQWLLGFAYRVEMGPEVFVITALTVVLITLATISYQAIKAAMADPVKSLRTE